jgi:hypothetical protein
MNAVEWDAYNKRFKEINADILNKLDNGYRFAPIQQGKNNMNPNNAETTIEEPFKEAEDTPVVVTADNIISRTEKDGETVAYEVVRDGELLFSTVSRPLAFAWIGGFNSEARTGTKTGNTKGLASDKATADPDKSAPVDPARISASNAANANDDKGASSDKVSEVNKRSQSRKRALL